MSLRFLADENFNGRVVAALRRERPDLDLIRAQDTELLGRPDEEVLELAARDGRVVLTHDISTMVGYAWDRVGAGLPMAGVVAVRLEIPIGSVLADLLSLMAQSSMEDMNAKVLYFPLRRA